MVECLCDDDAETRALAASIASPARVGGKASDVKPSCLAYMNYALLKDSGIGTNVPLKGENLKA